jgi:GAF domain-containing protein
MNNSKGHATPSDHDPASESDGALQWTVRASKLLAQSVPDTFLGHAQSATPLLRWFEYDRPLGAANTTTSLANSLQNLVEAAVEQTQGRAKAAFYVANRERTALHHVVGMTREYARCVDGFLISSLSLACGLAAATRSAVITSDVIEDPAWARWRWLANEFDYRACWSFPIETREGKLVGTFAMYHREPTVARKTDLELASVLTRAAAMIISDASVV